MQGAGEHFFARAVLAQQQNVGVAVRHAFEFAHGVQKRGGRADDAVAAAVRLQGLFEFLVLALQFLRVRFVVFVDVEQLADQGGQDFQQGDVVVQRAGAVAGAQAGEYAEGAVVGGYRQGDEHGLFGRHVFAQDGTAEEQGVVAHVVGHNHVGMFQYGAGDAFVGRVYAARDLFGRHAVGVAYGCVFVVDVLQDDAPLVQTEKFAHQLQHDFQGGVVRATVFAQVLDDLLQQQHFLRPPVTAVGL